MYDNGYGIEHAIHTEELSDRNSITKIKKTFWKFFQQAESEVEEFMNERNFQKVPPITFEVIVFAVVEFGLLGLIFFHYINSLNSQGDTSLDLNSLLRILNSLESLDSSISSRLSTLEARISSLLP